MEKVKWNSIDKKQNGLKQSKNDKSSTLPRSAYLYLAKIVWWLKAEYLVGYIQKTESRGNKGKMDEYKY